jgi:hypothetical protein
MNEQTQETNQPTSAAALRAAARPFITNPDTGNTYQVRRPTLASLIKANVMPENFFSRALERVAKKDFDGELTDQDLLHSDEVKRLVVTHCLFKPRVVDVVTDADADDVIEYEDIPGSDRAYIHAWFQGTLESSTVETTSGEVTQTELDTFSPVERSGEPVGAGENSAGA